MEMIGLGLKVDSKGVQQGVSSLKKLDGGGQRAERSLGNVTSAFRLLTGAAAAFGAQQVFTGITREAAMFERQMLTMQKVIETTGRASQTSAKQLREQARQLALGTLQSTEGIMQAQTAMLSFRNITGDTFDRAIEAATDMTEVMGGDLQGATLQLAKALEDPVKGMTALSRSGTVFTDAQREMVKAMVEAGDAAAAQNFILSELEGQYGGAAEAAAGGLAGAQDTLGQALQETKLALDGVFDISGKTTGAYGAIAVSVQDFNEALEAGDLDGHIALLGATAGAAGALTGAYVTLQGAIVATTVAQRILNTVMRANPLVLVASALVALTGALFGARNATLELGGVTASVGNFMKALWQETTDLFANLFGGAIGAVDEMFGGMGQSVGGVFSYLWETFKALAANIASSVKALVNGVIAYWETMGGAVAIIARRIKEGFTESFQSVLNIASGFWDSLQAVLSGDLSFGAFNTALENGFVNPMKGALNEINTLRRENFGTDYLGDIMEGANTALNDFSNDVLDTALILESYNKQTEEASKLTYDVGEIASGAASEVKELGENAGDAGGNIEGMGKSSEVTAGQIDALANSYQSLYDRLNPLQAAQRSYAQDLETLVTWGRLAGMTTAEIAEQVRLLNDEFARQQSFGDMTGAMSSMTPSEAYSGVGFGSQVAGAGEGGPGTEQSEWQTWLTEAEAAFTEFDSLQADTARTFQTSFGNAFDSILTGTQSASEAFKEMGRTILSSVVTAIGEMIAQLLVAKALSASMGIFGGPAGLIGGFAGMFDKGGNIPGGQWGIAGEYGPEIIKGPAQVTSRKDTAQMMGGQGVTVNVNNAPPGTEVRERQMNGKQIIDVLVADVTSNGRSASALKSTFGLQRQGR